MKMNKKGFTLIELLAVIVILAVIALIASPIILTIIQSSRESSQARSVENFATAIQNAVANVMYDTNYAGGDITVDSTTGEASASGANGTNVVKTPSYSGSKVVCTEINWDSNEGYLSMKGCSVGGSSTKFRYNNNPNDTSATTNGSAIKES